MNESVGESLLELMYRQSIKMIIPGAIQVTFAAYVLSINTKGVHWLAWISTVLLLFVIRPYAYSFIRSKNHLSARNKLHWICLIAFVFGSVLGACVWFFPQLGLSERYFISIQILFFITVSSFLCVGYTPHILCFSAPCLVQLSIVLLVYQGGQVSTDFSTIMVMSFCLYVVLIGFVAREYFSKFTSNLELAEEKSQLSLELKNALEKSEKLQKRAEANNRSKTRFLAAASHDLRQPVHVVSLYGAALETITSEQRVRDVVAEMNTAVESLSSQLDALLDLSKMDAGRVKPIITRVDIHSMVDGILNEHSADAKRKGVILTNEIIQHTFVMSDCNMLMQILNNIIGNAVKYTFQGDVKLKLNVENDISMLVCHDTGIGISEHDLEYIYEEFYQVGNTERNMDNGLGLGLSIVERLSKLLSHNIRIESSLGVGTRVMISVKQAVRDSSGLQPVEFPSLEVEHGSHYRLWIHLVDDESSVIKSMTILLMELGCKVSSTSTTNETIAFLQNNTPDTFFVDYRLQGNDSGIKTLNAIKSRLPNADCVMITGETLLDKSANLEDGVVVLRKPINKTTLTETLGTFSQKKYVRNSSRQTSAAALLSLSRE